MKNLIVTETKSTKSPAKLRLSRLATGLAMAGLTTLTLAVANANQEISKLNTPAQVETALYALMDTRDARLRLASYAPSEVKQSLNFGEPQARKVNYSNKSVAELVLAGLAITGEAKSELLLSSVDTNQQTSDAATASADIDLIEQVITEELNEIIAEPAVEELAATVAEPIVEETAAFVAEPAAEELAATVAEPIVEETTAFVAEPATEELPLIVKETAIAEVTFTAQEEPLIAQISTSNTASFEAEDLKVLPALPVPAAKKIESEEPEIISTGISTTAVPTQTEIAVYTEVDSSLNDSVDANVDVTVRSEGCPVDFNKISIPVNGKLCQIFAADYPASMILFVPQTPEEVIEYYLASSSHFIKPKMIKKRTMLKSADNNATLIIYKDGDGTQVDILIKAPVS